MKHISAYTTQEQVTENTESLYQCETCDDNGMLIGKNGQFVPCTSERCIAGRHYRANLIFQMVKRSEMPGRYREYKSFELWAGLPERYIEGKVTAILAAQKFVERRGDGFAKSELHARYRGHDTVRHSIILTGERGMGKTALASTIANVLVEKLVAVQFITPRGLWYRVKATFGKNEGETENDILRELIEVPVLIIDEFNIKPSDYLLTTMEHILRERYNSDTPRPVVITANADKQQLVDIWGGQAISSLFEVGHYIKMGGEPLRDEDEQGKEEAF